MSTDISIDQSDQSDRSIQSNKIKSLKIGFRIITDCRTKTETIICLNSTITNFINEKCIVEYISKNYHIQYPESTDDFPLFMSSNALKINNIDNCISNERIFYGDYKADLTINGCLIVKLHI